jgi:CARDB/Dockerin type I domain
MLSAALRSAIPSSITPSTVTQTLFAPGATSYTQPISTTIGAVTSTAYRFSVNDATAGQISSFATVAGTGNTEPVDAAIALYDASGNLLQIQDVDPSGADAAEFLGVALQSGQVYEVAVYAEKLSGSLNGNTLNLTVNPGPQATGDTILINPATGQGSLTTAAAPDAFTGPADVRYFPINFLDAGQTGQVAITAAAPDTSINATLYEQTAPGTYVAVATGTGLPTLAATPPPGGDLTDGTYVLAVSPLNFTAPAEQFTATVSSTSLLAPAMVSAIPTNGAVSPLLTAPGMLSSSNTQIGAGAAQTFSVTAPVTGPMTVEFGVSFNGTEAQLAVYGAGGTSLLTVASQTAVGATAIATFNAIAGTTYILRLGSDSSTFASIYNLSLSQVYTAPTPLSATSTAVVRSGVATLPGAGYQIFQVTPAAGADYLFLQLKPGSSAQQLAVTVAGATLLVQTVTAASVGAATTAIVNLDTSPGPVDVMVRDTSGTGGSASLVYGTVTVPKTLSAGQLPTGTLSIASGGLSTGAMSAVPGQLAGVQYQQLPQSTAPGASSVSATVASGAAGAILVHYVEDANGALDLTGSAATNGTAAATIQLTAVDTQLNAVAAIPVGASTTGTVTVAVAGPVPTGTGVAMVPNVLPGQTPLPSSFFSQFLVTGATLASGTSFDLWQTILPQNLLSNPESTTLTFTPNDAGGPLHATVSFLSTTGVLASGINSPGQPLSLAVAGLSPGQTVRIEVQPIADSSLGSGGYSLQFNAATTNPTPYFVTESTFFPFSSTQTNGDDYLPNGLAITPITYGSDATGNFTSNVPYSANGTGSIQMFSFTAPASTPFQVYTVDTDSTVNTDIALFIQPSSGGAYALINGTTFNQDYFPADRSSIDSKIVVNNYDVIPTSTTGPKVVTAGAAEPDSLVAATVYVVVMNEQGTLGHYQVWATGAPQVTLGPGTGVASTDLIITPATGASFLTSNAINVSGDDSLLNVQTPSDMSANATGTVTIQTADNSSGQIVDVFVSQNGNSVSTNSGRVPTGGQLILSLAHLNPSTNYTFEVETEPAEVNEFGVTLSVPLAGSSGPVPPTTTTSVPQDHAYSSTFTRIEPAPDGTISQSHFLVGITGTQFQDIFTVGTAGLVTLHTTLPSGSTNVAVGLYECGNQVTGSGISSTTSAIGVLVDYVNASVGGQYSFTDNLAVGTYELIVTGTVPEVTLHGLPIPQLASVTGSLPAYDGLQTTPPPFDGVSDTADEDIINASAFPQEGTGGFNGATFPTDHYGTYFYEVTIPSNATGAPFSVNVSDSNGAGDAGPLYGTGIGTISATIWKVSGAPITGIGALGDTFVAAGQMSNLIMENTNEIAPNSKVLMETDTPVPGAQYFIGIDFDGYVNPAFVGVSVPVFSSALPDLVVSSIKLSPGDGQTLVTLSVQNNSYGGAAPAPAIFSFTTPMLGPGSTGTPGLAPFGISYVQYIWTPANPSDQVTYTANVGNVISEASTANDSQTVVLSSVDAHIPSVTIALADPLMSGESTGNTSTGGGTWGRYLTGVSGQTTSILADGADADNDLYKLDLNFDGNYDLTDILNAGTPSGQITDPVDFGTFSPTSSSVPNLYTFQAIDAYGLRSGKLTQNLDVVSTPKFLTGGPPQPQNPPGDYSQVTFNPANHQYSVSFNDYLINEEEDTDGILNGDQSQVPVIGDTDNEFLVHLTGTTTAGMSPTANLDMPVSMEVSLEVVGLQVYDNTFAAGSQSNKVAFRGDFTLSGHTLEPVGQATASIILSNINILTHKFPLIPIFNYGIPKVAAIQAGFQFSISAGISAGVKLGFNPAFLEDPENASLTDVGVMSPTFIQPSVTGTAAIVGTVTILGYNAAELTGSIGLELDLTIGLDNSNPAAVFDPSDITSNLGFDISAKLDLGLGAKVFGISVFSVNDSIPLGELGGDVTNGIFLTDPPTTSGGINNFIPPTAGLAAVTDPLGVLDAALTNPAGLFSAAAAADPPTVTTTTGSSLVGAYSVDPDPQLVVDNSSAADTALSVQTVNVASPPNNQVGNLEVATRTNGTWSAQTVLPDADDVTQARLALTNDASGTTPAVVVYDADDTAGSPATQTVDQRLDSQDIRYRYYNGTSWGPEIPLTNDGLDDEEPSVAFNSGGTGVLAWVHNTDSAPVDSSGNFDANSNNIQASVWNASTHTWSAPLSVSSPDGVADGTPSTFVDSNGNRYVVWIRGSGDGNQLEYSMYNGSSWTTPQLVPIQGLPAGGSFNSVALGSDGSGRVDVLFSYGIGNSDGTYTSTLYDRPTTIAGFSQPATIVQISTGANYSDLQTTTGASGTLVAYWEQSDGVTNQIYSATVSGASAGSSGVFNPDTGNPATAWSTPSQLTDDPNVPIEPTLAVDGNGKFQVLYDNTLPFDGISNGNPTDPSVGAPLAPGVASSSVQALPQFGFTSGLTFANTSAAPTGSTATGTAIVVNRGFASAPVTISAYVGLPGSGTLIKSQTITLSPGSTFNVSQLFTVATGSQTYSIELTTPGAQAFDTTENLSTTTLSGLADVAAISLTPTVNNPQPGQAITLTADVRNLSTSAIGAFTVTLDSGDQFSPQFPVTVLASQQVSSLSALQDLPLTFNVTLPTGAGDDVYTVLVDSSNTITESNESNNEARYEIDFQADPAIYPFAGIGSAVRTTLNNVTGANNVTVTVEVTNLGSAAITNLPIDLTQTLNGVSVGNPQQFILSSLAAGQTTSIFFADTGFAGDNVYEASVDASADASDANLANNVGIADLQVQALPVLTASGSLSTPVAAAGGPLTFDASIANTGLADADNVPIVILFTPSGGGAVITVATDSTNVPALGDVSLDIPLNTTGLAHGSYVVTIEIDPGQVVLQASRAGNTATTNVIISAPVSLTGSAVYLRLDSNDQDVDVYNNTTGAGTPAQQILLSSVSGFSITASSGSQIVTVDASNGDPLPPGGLEFTGPVGGNNVLNLIGTTSADVMTVNASIVNLETASGSAAVAYSGITAINFLGNGGSDVLIQNAQPGGGASLTFVNPTSSDTLDVEAGQFTIPAPTTGGITPIVLGALDIASGALVAMAPPNGHVNLSVLILNSLTLAGSAGDWAGSLDLNANDLIIHNGVISQISSQIAQGLNLANNGYWNGSGIRSSAAAAASTTALGVELNSFGAGTPLVNTFDNQTVTNSDVLVKYTFYGDANLDGAINGDDYTLIDNSFNTQTGAHPLSGWRNGDFNYDGSTNSDDYILIDNAFNIEGSVSVPAVPAAVIANNTAQIANASPASIVVAHGVAVVRKFATVSYPMTGNDTDIQEFKKRRPGAWEMLEG